MKLSKKSIFFIKLTIIFVFTLILTMVVVSYSSEHGKLAIPPDYDDSLSIVEGGLRYLVWKNEGFTAAWHQYLNHPPHSFLHYYLVSALFALFGIHQEAVYWFGGAFVLVSAMGLSLLLLEVGVLEMAALLIAFLSLPVMFNMVFDFRSECAVAALLFTACCVAVRSAWATHYDRLLAILSGGFFALSLGMKPTMFIYVLGMLVCCGMVWMAAGVQRKDGKLIRGIMNTILAMVAAIIPFGFHYYLNSRGIFAYIYHNAFVSDVWKQKGTITEQLVFHLFGFAGKLQLGNFVCPLIGVTLIGGIGILIFRRKCNQNLVKYFWSLVFLTVIAYAGVAINSMNNNYFGMTFDLLLGGSAILVVAILADAMPRSIGYALCVMVAISSLMASRVPISQDYVERTKALGGDAALKWRREGAVKVFELIRKAWRKDTKPEIWVGAYGWVDGMTLEWEALKNGLPWKMWNYYEREPEPGRFYPELADILIIPESGVMGTIDLPLNKNIPAMATTAATDKSLKLVGTVSDPCGKIISVYLKRDVAYDSTVK